MNSKKLFLILIASLVVFSPVISAASDTEANLRVRAGGSFMFEGTTDNGVETILAVADPTSSDKTITLPDATGTVSLLGSAESFSGVKTFTADPLITGTTPSLTIGDAGEEDAQINYDGNVADFSIGLDDSVDSLVASLGTALGTTNIFSADGTTFAVVDLLTAPSLAISSGTAITKLVIATDTDLDSGDTSEVVTVANATSATRCFGTITNDTTTEVSITSIVTATGQATVQVSADPSTTGADLALLCIN